MLVKQTGVDEGALLLKMEIHGMSYGNFFSKI
jgi:hypothetical protein